MKTLIFILGLISLVTLSYAKVIKYEVRGTHQFKNSKPINFTLRWTEEGSLLKGAYVENGVNSLPLKGKISDVKRSFIITDVANRRYDVLFIETLPIKGAQTATIPLSITFMDKELSPLDSQDMRVVYHGEP